jgi:hypothetical protein
MQLAFYKERRQDGKNIDSNSCPGEHDEYIEDTEGVIVSSIYDLSVTDTGKSNDDHVDGVQNAYRRAAQHAVANNGNGPNGEEKTTGK